MLLVGSGRTLNARGPLPRPDLRSGRAAFLAAAARRGYTRKVPFTLARQYPLVVATLVVAALAGALSLTPAAGTVPWVLGVFAVAVAVRSFVAMVRDVVHGKAGVDVLAVTAICAAVAVGQFWAALVIVLMLTGGEALEDYAGHRARRDLTALLRHAPQVAHRLRADGTAQDVPIDDVAPGDQVQVLAGEVVPVDGVLTSERGEFDESSLTGESLPVDVVAGGEVLSGAVNGTATVVLRAKRSAKDSQYQQIVALVREAAGSRSRVVRLADRFAVPFTVVAFTIAGLAWWLSGEATRFAEVLVVATPCPLIIAAPVAFMAGMSRSAREGIIVKSSDTLETLRRARTVAFDKTGTLTQGHPSLVAVHPRGHSAEELLRLTASVEALSSHVLATAVLTAVRERGIGVVPATDARETPARGVSAQVGGHAVVVGKLQYVADAVGATVPAVSLASGEIGVYVAVDGAYAGALVLRDEVRGDAKATVLDVRAQGIEHVVMLTGDARPTAMHVAAELGITQVHAECLPADKVRAVRQIADRPVVMVGDGVNDAPVLAAADVGIAMGARGSTAASESADVVVLRDDIMCAARAIRVGRETVHVALQSIGIGIGLSVVLMLVAAGGVLPALAGAWTQEGVDLVSILWALRAVTGRRGDVPTGGGRGAQAPAVRAGSRAG
ncbi:MAG: heavy metal translocating P-type ATPase [Cellulomonadaceae bacterium]